VKLLLVEDDAGDRACMLDLQGDLTRHPLAALAVDAPGALRYVPDLR
jgi:hypothetical protein